MTYAGEGPIGFKAQRTGQNQYNVENQWGGNDAPWHPGGKWEIGGRDNQNVIALSVTSSDGGKTLNGTNTYANEGPIGFRGQINNSTTESYPPFRRRVKRRISGSHHVQAFGSARP